MSIREDIYIEDTLSNTKLEVKELKWYFQNMGIRFGDMCIDDDEKLVLEKINFQQPFKVVTQYQVFYVIFSGTRSRLGTRPWQCAFEELSNLEVFIAIEKGKERKKFLETNE